MTASHPDGVTAIRLYIDGVLTESVEGDTLEWRHDGLAGGRLALLAVAVAGDGSVDRAGWPAPTQTTRAETQGWTIACVQVFAAGAPTPVPDEGGGGCGCRAAPASPSLMLFPAMLLTLSRRRGSTGGSGSGRRSSSRSRQ